MTDLVGRTVRKNFVGCGVFCGTISARAPKNDYYIVDWEDGNQTTLKNTTANALAAKLARALGRPDADDELDEDVVKIAEKAIKLLKEERWRQENGFGIE